MIAVHIRNNRRSGIKEFFSLFHAPWDFFKAGQHYDVIISDDPDVSELNVKLTIVMKLRSDRVGPDRDIEETDAHCLLSANDVSFPVFCGAQAVKGESLLLKRTDNNLTVGSRLVTDQQTVICLGYNLFDEIEYLLMHGQPPLFARFPTADIHIALLRKWILWAGIPFVEIPPVPYRFSFIASLTHDVDNAGLKYHGIDHTVGGFLLRGTLGSLKKLVKGDYSAAKTGRNLLAVSLLPFVYCNFIKDYWNTFSLYSDIEKPDASTYFLVPFKNRGGIGTSGKGKSYRAVKYDCDELKTEIDMVCKNGGEIGVHGIDAWIDSRMGAEELDKIKRLSGGLKTGVRMHWLYFNKDSFSVLEKAGYDYDSTCGYNDSVGFKAGTLQVFQPIGVETLLELPMIVMDTALFYPDRMNLRSEEALFEIRSLVNIASRFGGVLTINWHDRSIAPERLWDDVYIESIKEVREKKGKIMTAGSAVDWFRKRNEIAFEHCDFTKSKIRVALSKNSVNSIDGHMIRIWLPNRCNETLEFLDFPITDQTRFEIPL
jgi:hypothetical protein